MNGRKKKRTRLLFSIGICFFCIVCTSAVGLFSYQKAAFEHISTFCEILIENNPETEQSVFSALKEYHTLSEQEIKRNDFLAQYGYTVQGFCKGYPFQILIMSAALFVVAVCLLFLSEMRTEKENRQRIAELTEYLERINIGTGGTILQTQEDDFSYLQDEIYKTVTTLYQTRETSVEARKQFAENLANIAHQLKTPITAAFLSLQLMERNVPEIYVKQMEKQLRRLNNLEESLLTLSKIDAGILPLANTKVDIYTALNLAAENLNDLLRKENVAVDIPDHGCMEFPGDLEWTMEALINLLKNCMEHSMPGGTVYCDYSANPLYHEILIWDEGTGFETEDIPHLFERFYRGRRAVGDGIGIGLALSRSIFELQNGTINAYNRRNGGACFEIRVYSH